MTLTGLETFWKIDRRYLIGGWVLIIAGFALPLLINLHFMPRAPAIDGCYTAKGAPNVTLNAGRFTIAQYPAIEGGYRLDLANVAIFLATNPQVELVADSKGNLAFEERSGARMWPLISDHGDYDIGVLAKYGKQFEVTATDSQNVTYARIGEPGACRKFARSTPH